MRAALCVWQQVRQEELYGSLAAHAQTLLDQTLVPVCVWRAGKVAGALRKASVSCMAKLMEAALIPADGLMLALGKGFEPGPLDPVLKTCLDDDDADVRFMTCGMLAALFVTVEGRLDDEQVVLVRTPFPVCPSPDRICPRDACMPSKCSWARPGALFCPGSAPGSTMLPL